METCPDEVDRSPVLATVTTPAVALVALVSVPAMFQSCQKPPTLGWAVLEKPVFPRLGRPKL